MTKTATKTGLKSFVSPVPRGRPPLTGANAKYAAAHAPPDMGNTHEVELGEGRILQIQRIEDRVMIAMGNRTERSVSSAIRMGGAVFLPLDKLREVLRVVERASKRKG